MSDITVNPLQSPYRESVLAAYSSACIILGDTKSQYFKRPQLLSRVIVGTVAIRGVHLDLQPPAFGEFESACTMFRDAAETSSRAARALLMLQKASQAREQSQRRQAPIVPEARPDDELSIFGGRTRLVSSHLESATQPLPRPIDATPTIESSRSSASQTRNQAGLPSSTSSPSPSFNIAPQRNHHNSHTQQQFDQRNHPTTFADLSGGWDGLFHEVPQPSRARSTGSPYPALESGDVTMLDDRWASFMHTYNILDEPSRQHGSTS
ncbi:hypothetical protein H0H87_006306 [Tephrocybe sp. NHM501043]|nr:hypothetical protein H0H87_006306 [Tephrocybe sp. NHM501043]